MGRATCLGDRYGADHTYMPMAPAAGTVFWYLPKVPPTGTMKSESRRSVLNATRTTRGSSGGPQGCRSKIATRGIARAAILRGGSAIPLHSIPSHGLNPLPLCTTARAPASSAERARLPTAGRLPGCATMSTTDGPATSQPATNQPAARQSVACQSAASQSACRRRARNGPSSHNQSRAGAATPTRPLTTQPQQPPRMDSDLVNGTPLARKDNPQGLVGNATETKIRRQNLSRGTGIAITTSITRVTCIAALACWLKDVLKDIPRRAGERLFMSADEEAHWRGWQIAQLWGGLSRVYRDPRFDTLRARSGQADGDSSAPQESWGRRRPKPRSGSAPPG